MAAPTTRMSWCCMMAVNSANAKAAGGNFLRVLADLRSKVQNFQQDFDNDSSALVLLSEFLHCPDAKTQLDVLKKLIKELKNITLESNTTHFLVHILVTVYLKCLGKRLSLKRLLISCFQSLLPAGQAIVVSVLEKRVLELVRCPANNDCLSETQKTAVEELFAILDNFKLGEKSISRCCITVLQFLTKCLKNFQEKFRHQSLSPVQQQCVMKSCLTVTQVTNKLLQRCSEVIIKAILDRRKEMVDFSMDLIQEILLMMKNDKMLIDCRKNSGMTFVLILQLWNKSYIAQTLLSFIFPKYNNISVTVLPDWLTSLDLSGLSSVTLPTASSMSLLWAVLVIMDSTDLMAEYADRKCLLLDVIFEEALLLNGRCMEIGTKLLTSTTILMWTSKFCFVLGANKADGRLISWSTSRHQLMLQRLLDYIWALWEDHSEAVKMFARNVFQNFIKLHRLGSGIDLDEDVFLCELMERLLCNMSWASKGKYSALCCLVPHLGTQKILAIQPSVAGNILHQMHDRQLASYAGELYCVLVSQWNVCSEKGDTLVVSVDHADTSEESSTQNWKTWCLQWLDPVLTVLCGTSGPQKSSVIEYILPTMMKINKQNLRYMIDWLSSENQLKGKPLKSGRLGALVTCLREARASGLLGYIRSGTSSTTMWGGVVEASTFLQVLRHIDNHIRIDGFALLCENPKTTQMVPETDLNLIQNFLSHNLNNQNPSFRQTLISYLKKLFIRIRESGFALQKMVTRKNRHGEDRHQNVGAEKALETYKGFLQKLVQQVFGHLYLGCSFATRVTSLSILSLILKVFGPGKTEGLGQHEFSLSATVSPPHIQTLLECLTDTFEENKMESFTILTSLPPEKLSINVAACLESLFLAATELSISTKPHDCTTAAYLFRLLLKQQGVDLIILKLQAERGILSTIIDQLIRLQILEGDDNEADVLFVRSLHLIVFLLSHLKDQIEVAKKSLVHAAATKPMYATMHCIRYILADLNFSSVPHPFIWQEVFKCLLDASFELAELVSPVVHNSSPEGGISMAAIKGPGFDVGKLFPLKPEHLVLAEAEKSSQMVALMPEYLVVCCWRSIKEVSLLLGHLCLEIPITDPSDEEAEAGLLSVGQILAIGEYFTKQLLQSKHRGAFELAYAGYVKMCEMLWKSPIVQLHSLPQKWLKQIMVDITSDDVDLCATRRSAGVPFYIQAIVSTEPETTGRICLKDAISQLLQLALPSSDAHCKPDNDAQVHALNILRALFRDTRLREDVCPYVADGLKAGVVGFSSPLWSIRNSATLLLSSLVTRIFGVNRSKVDNISRKNCLTGRSFFNRYPSLYQFLLDKLAEATEMVGCDQLTLHSRLYPVLMVLGRLFPSNLEGTDTRFSLDVFVPYVVKCSASPVFKTRVMASRALQPLVTKDQLTSVLLHLVSSMSQARFHQNHLHGLLVQVHHLSLQLPTLTGSILDSIENQLLPLFAQNLWLITRQNLCIITRKVALDVTNTLLSVKWKHLDSPEISTIRAALMEVIGSEIKRPLNSVSDIVGLSEFQVAVTKVYLQQTRKRMKVESVVLVREQCLGLLKSEMYEVRLEVLQWLQELFTSNSEHLNSSIEDSTALCRGIVGSCENIFMQLMKMITKEKHVECLAMVFSVLTVHPLCKYFLQDDQYPSAVELMMIAMEVIRSAKRNHVWSTAIGYSGLLLPAVYEELAEAASADAHTFFRDWCNFLADYSCTGQSNDVQLACAHILLENAMILLKDPRGVLGNLTLSFWNIVFNLLQEDSLEIKDYVARILNKLNDDYPVPVHPSLAMSLLLKEVTVNRQQDLAQYVCTLVSWTSQTEKGKESEERLFDRSEMNTYRDDALFTDLVASHLTQFLCSKNDNSKQTISQSDGTKLNNDPSSRFHQESTSMKPDYQSLVEQVLVSSPTERDPAECLDECFMQLKANLCKTITQMATITNSMPFLETVDYQSNVQCLYKTLRILALVEKRLLTSHGLQDSISTILEKLDSVFSSKATINSLISHGISFLEVNAP